MSNFRLKFQPDSSKTKRAWDAAENWARVTHRQKTEGEEPNMPHQQGTLFSCLGDHTGALLRKHGYSSPSWTENFWP